MAELSPEARAARNAYRRRWARQNPDKIREYAKRHWEKQANKERNVTDEKEADRV